MQNKLTTVIVPAGNELEFELSNGWMVHSFTQCGFSQPEAGKPPNIMFAVMLQRDDSADSAKIAGRNPIGGLGRKPAE